MIGKDYPAPIVNEQEKRKENLVKMKDCYNRQDEIKKLLWSH